MGFETKTSDDAVVVAVDVCVDTVQALKDLLDGGLEGCWEWHAWVGGEDGSVREEVRGPGEEVGDVAGSGETDGTRELWGMVPKVFEPGRSRKSVAVEGRLERRRWSYSSVAFISGHDCGLQNSVMAPYSKLIWL